MLTQEELNQRFPLPPETLPVKLNDLRYVVTWCSGSCYSNKTRYLIAVFDRFIGRRVFMDNTSDKCKTYEYIKSMYGKDNCIPPKEVSEVIMKQIA